MNLSPSIKAVFIASVFFAGAGELSAKSKTVPAGRWGGDHIALTVSDRGADIELDCAHGQVTQPIALDREGNFDVRGTLTPEHPGPARDDSGLEQQARYSGHVHGKAMTLDMTIGSAKTRRFVLMLGRDTPLTRCR